MAFLHHISDDKVKIFRNHLFGVFQLYHALTPGFFLHRTLNPQFIQIVVSDAYRSSYPAHNCAFSESLRTERFPYRDPLLDRRPA